MSRSMSFQLTTEYMRNQTKTVTRRPGWKTVVPGEIIRAVVKCMGLKKGEHQDRICDIRVISVREEVLDAITDEEVILEGFKGWDRIQFVNFFMHKNKCLHDAVVTRIEFEFLP